MTWAKVDDRLHAHRKARRAKAEAMGVWVMALSYCAANLTDGAIDADELRGVLEGDWRLARRAAQRLVDVGLWVPTETGFRFHDWADHQPTRAEVLANREKRAFAGRLGGLARAQARDLASAKLRARDPVPVPDPTRTDLGGGHGSNGAHTAPPTKPARKTRRRKLPDDWDPRTWAYAWARSDDQTRLGEDHVDRAIARFRSWATSNGKLYVDWDERFREWLRTDRERSPNIPEPAPPRRPPPPAPPARAEVLAHRAPEGAIITDLFAAIGGRPEER